MNTNQQIAVLPPNFIFTTGLPPHRESPFPAELWLQVFEHLQATDDPRTISHLAQCNRLLHQLSRRALYTTFSTTRIPNSAQAQASFLSFLRATKQSASLRPLVRNIWLRTLPHSGALAAAAGCRYARYIPRTEGERCDELFGNFLRRLPNLETLFLGPELLALSHGYLNLASWEAATWQNRLLSLRSINYAVNFEVRSEPLVACQIASVFATAAPNVQCLDLDVTRFWGNGPTLPAYRFNNGLRLSLSRLRRFHFGCNDHEELIEGFHMLQSCRTQLKTLKFMYRRPDPRSEFDISPQQIRHNNEVARRVGSYYHFKVQKRTRDDPVEQAARVCTLQHLQALEDLTISYLAITRAAEHRSDPDSFELTHFLPHSLKVLRIHEAGRDLLPGL
ncbi:hypothetical protein F4804DRAFT_41126 [Jackrogersella minutella]|nr:hypothetical protein F4804DRAFT_41126 [Jackrogersella minutella]